MSPALEEFERQLVSASRALYEAAELGHVHASQNGSVFRRRKKLFRRVRQLSLGVQLGFAVASLGSGLAGYLLLSGDGVTGRIAAFACQVGRNTDDIIRAVTGDPAIDCAGDWAMGTGGSAEAPPLTVWGSTTGGYAAVVRPTSWGPPFDSSTWRKLPPGWTVDLRIVALTDQLYDISLSPDGTFGIAPCTHPGGAKAIVRRFLEIDHLRSWRIVVRAPLKASRTPACEYSPSVSSDTPTVYLIPETASQLPRAERVAMRKVYALSSRVNRVLWTRCETVPAAAALWTREARAAGFLPATLSFWRALNGPNPPRDAAYHYTLYKQPPSQHTGACAHILVSVEGGGSRTVYAARITP